MIIKLLAPLALVAAVACGGSSPTTSGGGGAEIELKGFLFTPDSIEIVAGETVTWTNQDEILHTVTAGEPGDVGSEFDAELPDAGETFSFAFEEAGSFNYFCARHEHMVGQVTVVPA